MVRRAIGLISGVQAAAVTAILLLVVACGGDNDAESTLLAAAANESITTTAPAQPTSSVTAPEPITSTSAIVPTTTSVAPEEPTSPEEGPDPCGIGGRDGITTGHWFPEDEGGDIVGADADIYVLVPSDGEPLATTATLVASTDDGGEVRLALALGTGPRCRGDRWFDLPLGEAEALTELGAPFNVMVEFDGGAWITDTVRWPDDFPRTVPYGSVTLEPAPRTDGEAGGVPTEEEP